MSDLCKCGHARTEHAYVIEDGPCGAQLDGCQKYAPADRDDLAAILAKHDDWINNQDGTAAICDCKAVISTSNSWTECEDAHRAHVAQMVLESDWLRGVKAEVWEEGYEDCLAGDACRCHSNPYRADRVDAEDGGR